MCVCERERGGGVGGGDKSTVWVRGGSHVFTFSPGWGKGAGLAPGFCFPKSSPLCVLAIKCKLPRLPGPARWLLPQRPPLLDPSPTATVTPRSVLPLPPLLPSAFGLLRVFLAVHGHWTSSCPAPRPLSTLFASPAQSRASSGPGLYLLSRQPRRPLRCLPKNESKWSVSLNPPFCLERHSHGAHVHSFIRSFDEIRQAPGPSELMLALPL